LHDITRTIWAEWGFLIFKNIKGINITDASSYLMCLEIGGMLGILTSGPISDRIFKGKRAPVNFVSLILISVNCFIFWIVPSSEFELLSFVSFLVGYSVFLPQSLLGVALSESTHSRASGTALGILGAFAAAGASFAGYPLSKLVEYYGWNIVMYTLVISGIGASLFHIPLFSTEKKLKTD